LLGLAESYRKLGDSRAAETYQRIIREYADQKDAVAQAQARLGEKVWPGQVMQLTWVDRAGNVIDTLGPAGMYRGAELSPDERRIAGYRGVKNGTEWKGAVWVGNSRQGLDKRFANDEQSWMPIWSPDGMRIVFASLRRGKWGLYIRPSNGEGAEELLLESETFKAPTSWSPDGRFIVYWLDERSSDNRRGVSWVLPLTGNRQPFPLLDSTNPSNQANGGQISPDGKWIAYYSRESGQLEVYVKPFPLGPGKWKVSTEGGNYPRWRGDGAELYFMSASGDRPQQMMAVEIRAVASSIQAGAPRALFDTEYVNYHGTLGNWHAYAVSHDGQRFLIPRINVTGTWKATSRNVSWALAIQQNGRKLTGAIRGCDSSPVEIFDGTVDGNKVTFAPSGVRSAVYVWKMFFLHAAITE
jgi:hypothetical protein